MIGNVLLQHYSGKDSETALSRAGKRCDASTRSTVEKKKNNNDIHTKETRIERDACTPVFIATLFTIARTWKQPRRPLVDEWIRKFWFIYTVEYYSAIKKNTFESVLMRWMKLEPIIQSEVRKRNTNAVC